MEITRDCPLAAELAHRLRTGRDQLTRRWLERISARVESDPSRVFPTESLLDHVPLLLMGIADYLENPADEVTADMPVVAKAMELGELRHGQGFAAHEILKEYEIMGGVLFSFLTGVVDDIPAKCSRGELLNCGHRLFRAVTVIQQVTTDHYLRLMGERIRERENRLRGFNRMVSHELKNRIGAILSAGQILGEGWSDGREQRRFLQMIDENAHGIQTLLANLIELSRLEAEIVVKDRVPLNRAIAEVLRQLRELARQRNVEVSVGPDLPDVNVNAAAVELCLSNYVSNAIKYADPNKPERWAKVRAYIRDGGAEEPTPPELVIEVRDNGLGVPEDARDRLFQRFFRADDATVTGAEGTGLGLSIVRDTAESLGGRAWAEFDDYGSKFAFSLPLEEPD